MGEELNVIISENMINKKMYEDIDVIVKRIIAELEQQPYAIYLCGGYGRDEGAWWIDDAGNIRPYNDYDFAVITDTPMERVRYLQIRKELAESVGISWIDINFYSPEELKTLSPSIKTYDLLNASKILYGNYSLNTVAPSISVSDIGDNDIDILYRTRLWTFLGSWTGSFRNLDKHETMFFRNQMAKAILAACDMLLINNKAYDTSYKIRTERICELYADDSDLCEMAKWALNEKLRPQYTSIKKDDMESLYWRAKKIFENAFRVSSPTRGYYYLNPDKTKTYYYRSTKYILSNSYNRLFKRSKGVERNRDVFLIQNYIFCANNRGVINNKYINKAIKLLQKWQYIDGDEYSWDDLRIIISDIRNGE